MSLLNRVVDIAQRSPALRAVLDRIGTRRMAAAALRLRPIRRRVPGSRLEYRAVTLDNVLLAREIFENGEYSAIARFGPVHSFIDLGCNCGYFSLLMAAQGDPASIRGLAVDAHPMMVEQARWHVAHNDMRNVHAVWGLVGAREGSEGQFYLNVDPAGSSQFPRAPAGNVTRDPWRATSVPVVSVAETWTKYFGDAPCDVMKVDIEGSEDTALRREEAFLGRVGLLVIEMHRWLVDVAALDAWLVARGFAPAQVLRSNDDVHVALYVNGAGRFFHAHQAAGARQS